MVFLLLGYEVVDAPFPLSIQLKKHSVIQNHCDKSY